MPPLKLAVVGGGPSAFYVASRLLQLLPLTHSRADDLRIHIYDRLWAPYGLVRYGVAPDHPDVKNCTHKFDAIAADPRVRFHGNVQVARAPAPVTSLPHALPLALRDLLPHYTHLVLAPGAPIPRTLSHLPHAVPAINLVHWYTRHPSVPSTSPIPKGTRHITLIGLGNVVLDIARLLLTPPNALAALDIPAHVLTALQSTWDTLEHVSIVGRRGPREARWAPKELRELLGLSHARMTPISAAVLDDAGRGTLSRQETRVLQLLRAGSTVAPAECAKSFSLDFWRGPVAHTDGTLVLEDTRTRGTSTVPTDLVVTSLGFSGDGGAFAGGADGAFEWFDTAAGHLRHRDARVLTPAGAVVRNVYAAGWAAHGARGVIAGTLLDARAVAANIVHDHYGSEGVGSGVEDVAEEDVNTAVAPVEVLPRAVRELDGVPLAVAHGVRAGVVPGFAAWRAVDAEERRRGAELGKERERMAWEDARMFLKQTGVAGVE